MRLFVAIDIEDAIRERISRFVEGVRGFAPDARWINPESFHITLKFLGEMPEDRLADIKQTLAQVRAQATTISFRGTGFFPTPKSARVFWVGIEPDEHLPALAATVDDALQQLPNLGLKRERNPYRPHLTLARAPGQSRRRASGGSRQKADSPASAFKRLQEKLASMASLDFGTMTAREYFLYQSKLSPSGARYTKLERFPL
jgi:2'-5' RNA ligase